MIEHPTFGSDEWKLYEAELQSDIIAETESIFALSNGHIGLRGNLDEGEPNGIPGTYMNSVYELHPLPYAENAYGNPESGQTVINVTNGKLIRLLVDDEPFDVRYGETPAHERELDFRDGVLRRNVTWVTPTGRTVKISSVRMVSFTQRSVVAISYEVECVDAPVRVMLQSELVANEAIPVMSGDPRVGAVLQSPLEAEENQHRKMLGLLIHRTKHSGLRVAVAMDHTYEGPASTVVESESFPDIARVTFTAPLQPGETLRIVKLITYVSSSESTRSTLHDQVIAAISAARSTGWENLLAEQCAYLDDFWSRADVEIEGDPRIQQAVHFALFHILQAGARAERRPIPAKGLTGSGYGGHAFWDTEIFVLPVITMTFPQAAADALRWRYSTLEMAKKRATQLGLKGAAFPWRTIHGEECSGYWPASTAAFHINADIAYAVVQYVGMTGDTKFEEEVGLELLVETARLWASLGHIDVTRQFRIDGVTGPDEYSALANNNVYTNLMAQYNLCFAVETAQHYPEKAQALNVTEEELSTWQHAADNMFIPYDERLEVTPQDDSFTRYEVWDFEHTKPYQYPLMLHFPYFDLYRKQVVKQADLVLAMQLCSDSFSLVQKARNFAYYEPLTVRDSSLSACPQSVIAAEVGQLDLAYDYLYEAVLMDLANLEHNGRDGLHMASLAGAWSALVNGFGGMRTQDEILSFSPRLPKQLKRLCFFIMFQGSRIKVEMTQTETRYQLLEGETVEISHHGNTIRLPVGEIVTQPIVEINAGPCPQQPVGCEPKFHAY